MNITFAQWHCFDRRGCRLYASAVVMLVAIIVLPSPLPCIAAVISTGDVDPVPPTTGGGIGSLTIGASQFGSVTITAGTALSASGLVTLGTGASGIGQLALSGLGSNLEYSSNGFVVGDAGIGSVQVSNLAQLGGAGSSMLGEASGSSGDVTITGLGSTWNNDGILVVGGDGRGTVLLSGGGRLITASDAQGGDAIVIGDGALGDGRVSVTGSNSLWTVIGNTPTDLIVGADGRGRLEIVEQGRVNGSRATSITLGQNAGSIGIVEIDKSGSQLQVNGTFTVANLGHAVLSISNGARVFEDSNRGHAVLAQGANSNAQVQVSGLGSVWDSAAGLDIAVHGTATMTVSDGGRVVNTGNARIGRNMNANGTVSLAGQGSLWQVDGVLEVSELGSGTLNIGTGASVIASYSFGGLIADNAIIGARGHVALSGGRLSIQENTPSINDVVNLVNNGTISGSGLLDVYDLDGGGHGQIENAGLITAGLGQYLTLDSRLINSGLLHVNGGEIDTRGFATNSGQISARNGAIRFGTLDNIAGGQLAGVGGGVDVFGAVTNQFGAQIIAGADTNVVFHNDVINEGDIFAMPTATILMLQDLSLGGSSALQLNLAGVDQYSQIQVAGDALLAGEIGVGLSGSFRPGLGDSFQVITAAGGISGTFATSSLPVLSNGLSWRIDYFPVGLADSVILSVVSGMSADFNNDGLLNCIDIDMLVAAVVEQQGISLFDLTGDGQLNLQDVHHWLGVAGATNLPSGNPYLSGDANLDGAVDGSDFGVWNANKFTMVSAWCSGDFNADGAVDGSDFGTWNANKFQMADGNMVPEPAGAIACMIAILLSTSLTRKF